ncbi:MAG: hypothetical protein ACLFS3_02325 [Candidatus Aenigmatarchaeota archaeon]
MKSRIIDVTSELVLTEKAEEWCSLPYPDHPGGCPNYGEKEGCPPDAPDVDKFIDLNRRHWFVVVRFDLGSFEKKMKDKHPDWTSRQARCLLYWQNSVRKRLRKEVKRFKEDHPETVSTEIPEAMGVHVLATARKFDIPIRKDPEKYVYKIALVGYPA